MGIKSTHIVTRSFAIAAIERKLYEATDEQLASMLEEAIHNGFYNFTIVSDQEFEENRHKEYPDKYLYDPDNLPEYNDAY